MGLKKTLFAYSVFILCSLFLGGVVGSPYIAEVSCPSWIEKILYNLPKVDSAILKYEKLTPENCTIIVNTDENRFVVMSYYKYNIEITDSLVLQDNRGTKISLTGFEDFPVYEKSIIFNGPVTIHFVMGSIFNRELAFELLFTEAHDPPCYDSEFLCSNKKCIKSNNVCDQRNNCGDFSDERDCNRDCHATEFLCDNKMCIPGYKVCNGNNDCGDKSDEDLCETECVTGQFRCNNTRCIAGIKVCDGKNDCGDASDENECRRECLTDEFHCDNSRCTLGIEVCDGKNDCGDRSDEYDCDRECYFYEFRCSNGKCTNKNLTCNTKNDCGDWSDEQNCTSIHITHENRKVPESCNPWFISTVVCGGLLICFIVFVIMLMRESVVNKNNTVQTTPPATYPRTQLAYIRMDKPKFKVEE